MSELTSKQNEVAASLEAQIERLKANNQRSLAMQVERKLRRMKRRWGRLS